MNDDELGQWYERYGALVQRRCRTLMGNEADANDALQDTFMRAQRAARGKVMQPLPWLYAIATRICFDALAVKRREVQSEQGVLVRLKDLLGLADAASNSVEDKLCMGSALLGLDEQTRQMALLHWLDGLTQEEVAQNTGYSRKTVGVKLRLAEGQLRALFGDALTQVTP